MSGNGDYISRDVAIANSREYNLGGSYDNTERAVPVDAINSIPAADVRPVVRAKWIEDWETGCSECSACHDTFLWEDYKGVAEWNFCPNCGADMRGESDV